MTAEQFAAIKKKVESAKEKKARAEGALSKIEELWQRDFEISTIEEAEEKIKELETEIDEGKKKLEKMYSQLEKVTSWEEV